MTSKLRIDIWARVFLVAGGLTCAVGMIGPFQGIEHALVPWDKAAHFVAFYGLTSLLFMAFPERRRLDLTMLAILAGCGIEILQGAAGRDSEIGDILANSLGALAVLAPGYLEQARANVRASAAPGFARRRERRRGVLAKLRANRAGGQRALNIPRDAA